jgi:hypothetical protein
MHVVKKEATINRDGAIYLTHDSPDCIGWVGYQANGLLERRIIMRIKGC